MQSFAGRIFPKLGVAVLFAGLLALATTGTLEQGLRYVAATCLLISFWLFGVALARRRSFARLSEWDEGFLSLIHIFPQYYEPLFLERDHKGRTVSIVDEWCCGYVKGIALDPSGWKPFIEEHPDLSLIHI